MNNHERECPNCQRIYEAADVPDDSCPFCEPGTRLQAVGGPGNLIADLFSVELGWPRGQEKVLLTVSRDYMDAQITKAQLESNNIPVIIEGGGLGHVYSLTIGNLAAYNVFVPVNLLQQARQIFKNG